ncbi:Hypothetical_protein [Hexamita inflata]|uniref:Hypothetical_protein n=1 Tax=Hexamita inflata TaxID=28002 RepID=A0ABP1KFE8_9EUKA
MQKAKDMSIQAVAAAATSAVMQNVSNISISNRFIIPTVKCESKPTVIPFVKIAQNVVVDQISGLIPQHQPSFIQSAAGLVSESIVSNTLNTISTSILTRTAPSPFTLFTDIAEDSVKNAVYNYGRQRTDYKRPVNNFVWGVAAGAVSEAVAAKIENRKPEMAKRGFQTGISKLVYGEVTNALRGKQEQK